jgi:hypothetical protein
VANEITLSGSISYSKNKAKAALAGSATASQTGDHYVQEVQDVGTVEEQLAKGDIGTIGWCAFRNMDTVNFVQIGAAAGEYSIKLGPGEFHGPMRWSGSAVYAKADTAACKVEYLLLEL